MSTITHSQPVYTTFLNIVKCNLIGNYSLLDIAKDFTLDVKYNKERTILYNNEEEIQKATPICSTRFKNKLNPKKDGTGFVKITLPDNKTTMAYTNPTDLINEGTYCIHCNMHGPYAHTETCIRPRKSSLYLTLYGIMNSIKRYEKYDISEIIQKIEMSDLEKFKYSKNKNFEIPVNRTIKERIIEFFSNVIDKNPCSTYSILDDDDKCKPLTKYTRTTIPISTLVALPNKEQKEYLTGCIVIKHKNAQGVGVTIRIRIKDQKTCCIELVSNPYSNQNLYIDVINKINSNLDEPKIEFDSAAIKSFFASTVLFSDKTKELDIDKIMNHLWPQDYNDVRLRHKDIMKRLFPNNLNSVDDDDNKEFSYIYLNKDSDHFYRYTAKSDYEMHKNRIVIELIDVKKTHSDITVGPNKIHIQLFEQGHFQSTFTYCNLKDKNTVKLSVFKPTDYQFNHIKNTIDRISREFVGLLIKLDSEQGIVGKSSYEKPISKKTTDTIGGTIPYTKRRKFEINDIVQKFYYPSMTWLPETYKIVGIIDSKSANRLYKIVPTRDLNGKILEERHNVLRKENPSTDQVCRLCHKGIQKHPVPYSFISPVCQNGYDKIVKPDGVVARDNRYYPCPTTVDFVKDTEWLYKFILNGLDPIEKLVNMVGYVLNPQDSKLKVVAPNVLFEKQPDPLCGTFKPGTTSIGSVLFVEKAYLEKLSAFNLELKLKNKYHSNQEDEEMEETETETETEEVYEDSDEESEYDSEEEKYVRVKIIDKKKPHGIGNDNLSVIYTVIKYDSIDTENPAKYTILGKYFHPMHIENRNFIGFNELVKIRNIKRKTEINVSKLLIECYQDLNLLGNQRKHKYSNHLKLAYNDPEHIRKDMYVMRIPHTMNMLTHTVIEITQNHLIINDVIAANNNIPEIFKSVKLQCLCYRDTQKDIYYVIDTIDSESSDRHRIDEAKQYLVMYDLLSVYNDSSIKVDIRFEIKYNEFLLDEDNCTNVYVPYSSKGQRYIVPKGICKRLIVLQVLNAIGSSVELAVSKDDDKDDENTITFNTELKGAKVGDFVLVKINLLPSGCVRDDCHVLCPKIVSKNQYLGPDRTRDLLNFILKKSTVV